MFFEFDKSVLYASGDAADYWYIDPPTFADPDESPAEVAVHAVGNSDIHFHKRPD